MIIHFLLLSSQSKCPKKIPIPHLSSQLLPRSYSSLPSISSLESGNMQGSMVTAEAHTALPIVAPVFLTHTSSSSTLIQTTTSRGNSAISVTFSSTGSYTISRTMRQRKTPSTSTDNCEVNFLPVVRTF